MSSDCIPSFKEEGGGEQWEGGVNFHRSKPDGGTRLAIFSRKKGGGVRSRTPRWLKGDASGPREAPEDRNLSALAGAGWLSLQGREEGRS